MLRTFFFSALIVLSSPSLAGEQTSGDSSSSSSAEVIPVVSTDRSAPMAAAPVLLDKPNSEVLLDVLKRALVDNPTVRSQKSQIAATDFDLQAAQWSRFPALSVSSQATQSNSNQRTVTVEQPIWTGGRISSTIEFAQALRAQAQATLTAAQQQVLSDTTTAFFEVLRLENRYEAARANTTEHLKLVDLIARRVKLEVSPVTDEVLARSRAQLAKTEELQVARQLQTVRLQLNQLVGSAVSAIRSSESFRFVEYQEASQAIDVALKFSPLRQQAQANIEGAIAQIGIASSTAYPSIVVGYQRSTQENSGVSVTNGTSYVGVQLAPGSGLAAFSTAKAAEFRRQAAQDSLMAVEQQVTSATASAFAETLNFAELIEPNKAFLEGMEEVLDSYLRQYQIGRKGWLDVLNAQREKTQSQVAYFDALYGLQASRLRLMYLTGDLTAANIDSMYE